MRIFALPVALLLGAALYMLFPPGETLLDRGLRALLARAHRLFTTKRGRTDSKSALAVFLLALASAAMLLGAIHPLACVLVMAPLFSGFSPIPAAAKTKQELDEGRYSKDVPGYERRVLEACLPLGGAFAYRVAAPLLLCALGCLLHVGGALGWVYAGLAAAREDFPAAKRVCALAQRAGDAAMVLFLLLCAGLVGRNPLRVRGSGAQEKLMHLLGLEGEADHAPIAGDITQAIFLCLMSAALLCALLTAVCLAA